MRVKTSSPTNKMVRLALFKAVNQCLDRSSSMLSEVRNRREQIHFVFVFTTTIEIEKEFEFVNIKICSTILLFENIEQNTSQIYTLGDIN